MDESEFTADEGDGLEVFEGGCLIVAVVAILALSVAAYFAAGLLNGH